MSGEFGECRFRVGFDNPFQQDRIRGFAECTVNLGNFRKQIERLDRDASAIDGAPKFDGVAMSCAMQQWSWRGGEDR